MNGQTMHGRGDRARDDLADRSTISRLRIELHPSAGHTSDEAIPIEIAPELTQPYPLGLRDDLCRLSICRPCTVKTTQSPVP